MARALVQFWEVRGYLTEGRSYLAEALGREGADSPTPERAKALNAAAVLAWMQGDSGAARALFEESLAIRRELGDKGGYAWSVEAFARLSARVVPERAARLWGAAESLRQSLGLPLPPNEREEYDRHRSAAREALGEEAFAGAWAEGRAMTSEQAIDYALDRDGEPGASTRAAGGSLRGAAADDAPAPPLLTTKLARPVPSPS